MSEADNARRHRAVSDERIAALVQQRRDPPIAFGSDRPAMDARLPLLRAPRGPLLSSPE